MEKTCKCTSCDMTMDCPKHCGQEMEKKEDNKMHCSSCGHVADEMKCAHCKEGGETPDNQPA